MDAEIDAELMDKLRHVSVATLTTVLYKRGFRNQFIHGVGPINPDGRRMVGPAYTVRTIPAREDKAVRASELEASLAETKMEVENTSKELAELRKDNKVLGNKLRKVLTEKMELVEENKALSKRAAELMEHVYM